MTLPIRPVTNSAGHYMGWTPDLPDHRDHQYALTSRTKLPDEVRLDQDEHMPPVYDQLQLGSCTGNGVAAVVHYDLSKQGMEVFPPSRLFIYYGERVIERTVSQDSGAQIRDGIKVIARLGVCNESVWPYDIGAFTNRPSTDAYEQALDTKAVEYQRVPRTGLRRALADGHPVVYGWSVYSNIEGVASSGVLDLPAVGDGMEGGHCTVACGYKMIKGQLYYRVRNSWGPDWADGGYFWQHAGYIDDPALSSDFWTVSLVS